MMDPMEAAEASAERRYEEMLQPDGRLKCGCGELFRPDQGATTSPYPWAMPVCPTCFDKWLETTQPLDAPPPLKEESG